MADLLTVSVSMRTTSMSSCRQLSLRMPPMMAKNLPMGTAACPDRARRLLSSCGPVGMGMIGLQKVVWRFEGTHPKSLCIGNRVVHAAQPPYLSAEVGPLDH